MILSLFATINGEKWQPWRLFIRIENEWWIYVMFLPINYYLSNVHTNQLHLSIIRVISFDVVAASFMCSCYCFLVIQNTCMWYMCITYAVFDNVENKGWEVDTLKCVFLMSVWNMSTAFSISVPRKYTTTPSYIIFCFVAYCLLHYIQWKYCWY